MIVTGVIKDVMSLRKNLCILRHKLKRPSASSFHFHRRVAGPTPNIIHRGRHDLAVPVQLSCITYGEGSWRWNSTQGHGYRSLVKLGETEKVQLEGILEDFIRIEAHVQTVIC